MENDACVHDPPWSRSPHGITWRRGRGGEGFSCCGEGNTYVQGWNVGGYSKMRVMQGLGQNYSCSVLSLKDLALA